MNPSTKLASFTLANLEAKIAPTIALLFLAIGCGDSRSPERATLQVCAPPALDALEATSRSEIERRAKTVEALVADRSAAKEDRARAFGELGRVLDAHDLDRAASGCYANAAELAPKEFAWPYLQGHLELSAGAAEAAAKAFARALEITPDQPLALVGAARAAALIGDWAQSQGQAERALARDPGLALAWTVLAAAQMAQSDAAGAVNSYRQALRLQPGATRIYGQLATALARTGDMEGARTAEALRGEGVVGVADAWLQQVADERRDAVGRREAGERAFLAGDFGTAQIEFAAAIAADPTDADSLVGLGSTLARTGRWREATRAFEQALTLRPDHALAHFNLGVALQQEALVGDPEDRAAKDAVALEQYREALAADPGLDDARQNLANLLRRSGRCPEAEGEYRAILERDPSRSAASTGLAACRARTGDYSGAREILDLGLRAAPGQSNLLLAKARLLAAAPDENVRNGREALTIAQALGAQSGTPLVLETAAMAFAETGNFPAAIERQSLAIRAAKQAGMSSTTLTRLVSGLERFERGQPVREPAID